MGTTANKAFPYPEDSDLVTDGAAAMRALAEAVDAELTRPVVTYTPTFYGGTLNGGTLNGRYFRLGAKMLWLSISYSFVATDVLPAQIQVGLPPGLLANVSSSRTQSLFLRYYTEGSSQFVGFASTSSGYGNGDRFGLVKHGGGVLGSADFLASGANLDFAGYLELA